MRTGSKRSYHKPGERNRLADWRRERLINAGFPPNLAEQLAHQRATDLHALLELIDRGCSAEFAARILAPLDEELDQ